MTYAKIQLPKPLAFEVDVSQKGILSRILPGVKTGNPELDRHYHIKITYHGREKAVVKRNIQQRLIFDSEFHENLRTLVGNAKGWKIDTETGHNAITYEELGWITDKQRLRQILESMSAMAEKFNVLEIP